MTEEATATGSIVAQIEQRSVPPRALGIWWLGQASFVIKGSGTIIYIDPYLAPDPHRLVPPPFSPDEAPAGDLVLCTHDHSDHVDHVTLPALARSSPRAKIVIPYPAREQLIAEGIDAERLIVPVVDEPMRFGEILVTAIPAAHESLDYSPERGYPYLGYIVEINGVKLYHSGDCTIYEGLLERLREHKPDVAFLPINGADWKRRNNDIVGNMSYRDAADLADAAGIDLTIPMHYGMFRTNTVPPGYFVNYVHDYYPALKTHVMARYEGLIYVKP